MPNGNDSNTSGENTGKFRFTPKGANDRLSQEVIDELTRRGFVVIEKTEAQSNLLLQPTEPEDKTKIWWQTDLNGVPIGQPKTYSTTEGRWLPISGDAYTPPLQRNGFQTVTAGDSEPVVPFEELNTANYMVTLTPTLNKGDGSFISQPGAVPGTFSYYVKTQLSSEFQFVVRGAPTGGIVFQWEAHVIPS